MGKEVKEKITITITRALGTLKLLDKRIKKAIQHGHFANYVVGGEAKIKDYTPKRDLQSVNDLIEYRSNLKSGIMTSNAKTKVRIGKTVMTVVQAIETKDSIEYKKALLSKMVSDLQQADNKVTSINQDVKYRLDEMIRSSYSGDKKPTSSDYDAIAKPFLKTNEAKLVDSEVYMKIVLELEEEIDTFIAEVDLVLSESNATTFIEV